MLGTRTTTGRGPYRHFRCSNYSELPAVRINRSELEGRHFLQIDQIAQLATMADFPSPTTTIEANWAATGVDFTKLPYAGQIRCQVTEASTAEVVVLGVASGPS